MTQIVCADLYDKYEDELRVMLPKFNDYGGKTEFMGQAVTLKVYEDNTLVRAALEESGEGKVLVIDAGESMRCAMVGDNLAELGVKNGWRGIIVAGCIRDSAVIKTLDIGVKAMNTNPRKSVKKGAGDRDISINIAGITVNPNDYIYADVDGVVVSDTELEL